MPYLSSTTVLTAPPAFLDPPPGGYTYDPDDQSNPFYYNPAVIDTGCAIPANDGACTLPITSANGQTLNFVDSPAYEELPSGGYMGFKTSLVGLSEDTVGKTFYRWSWISTYTHGEIGGTQTKSSVLVDGSGTGGVTIISINGVPQTGDINGDGVVNCADLDIVKASFGKKAGQAGFDMRADVNDDGVVNILDLSFVAKQLPAGTVCQ